MDTTRDGISTSRPALLDTLAVSEALFHDTLHWCRPLKRATDLLALRDDAGPGAGAVHFRATSRAPTGADSFFTAARATIRAAHYGTVGVQVLLDAWPVLPSVAVFLCFVVAGYRRWRAAAATSCRSWQPAGGWLVNNSAARPLSLSCCSRCWRMRGCWLPVGGNGKEYPPRRVGGRERSWPAGACFPGRMRPLPSCSRSHPATRLWMPPTAARAISHGFWSISAPTGTSRAKAGSTPRVISSPSAAMTRRSVTRSSSPAAANCGFMTSGCIGGHTRSGRSRCWELWRCFLAVRRRAGLKGLIDDGHGRQSFVSWFYGILAAAGALALIWGTKQDGPLYYYNASSNYSIFFGLALGFAAALAAALMAWTASPSLRRARRCLAALLLVWNRRHGGRAGRTLSNLHLRHARRCCHGQHEERAAAAFARRRSAIWTGVLGGLKSAAAVALELARLGHKVRVSDDWEIMYGRQNTIQTEKMDAVDLLSSAGWLCIKARIRPAELAGRFCAAAAWTWKI